MRAVLFARVSSGKQAGEERFSIPTQLREMREFCGREGLIVVDELVAPGRSASVSRLELIPELLAAVVAVECGQARVLVYHDSTRLSRNNLLANEILNRIERAGGTLRNVQGSTDYHTPEGHAFFQMENTFSTLQGEKIGEHARKGKRGQFLGGIQVGGFPWPYQRNDSSRSAPPRVDPAEASVLRQIFEDFAIGRGCREIARELAARGVRPPGRTGYWIPQTVDGFRTNRYYLGEIAHHGQWREGNHEALISEQLFAAAAARGKRASRSSAWAPMLLQGIAKCAEGHRLYPFRPNKGKNFPGVFYEYYRDPSKDFNRPCSVGRQHWPVAEPDTAVRAVIRSLALDEPWLRYIESEARKPLADDASDERRKLQSKRKRAVRAWIEQNLPEDEYREIIRGIDARLSMLPAAQVTILPSLDRLLSFQQLWADASATFRNDVCRTLFSRVQLNEDESVTVEPWPEFEDLFCLRRSYVSESQPERG